MSHVVLSATVCVKVPTHGAGPAALRIPADARVIWSELALPDSALPSLVLGFLQITRGDVRALPPQRMGVHLCPLHVATLAALRAAITSGGVAAPVLLMVTI